MSYILDALKKLEHEKTRKSRGAGMVTISGALLEPEPPRPVAKAGWKIALAVAVAVLLTFGATWYVLRPDKGSEKPAPRVAAPVPASVPAPAPAAPEVPPAPSATPVIPEPPVALPAMPPARALPVAPTAAVKPVQSRPAVPVTKTVAPAPAAATAEDAAALLTMQQLRSRTKERPGQKLSSDQLMAVPTDITLSGIAWQDERRARRAVVNGFLMQEGGVVSGARITDIYQDRVRFTISGKYFEIPLTSAGFPATGK